MYESRFLISLAVTITAETLLALAYLAVRIRVFSKTDIALKRFIILVAFASAMTLPYLWFIFPLFLTNKILFIVFGEINIWTVETVFYLFTVPLKLKEAALFSFLANLFSFLIGLIIGI